MNRFDVVIVEDEELERTALRRILETKHDGVRIVGEARNGAEAVRLIDTVHIDLMLVDIRIPRPNGLEIIQILRDRGLPVKVIILTAYDHFEIMKEAIHLRADNFLLKPVRTKDLLDAVTECLGGLQAPVADEAEAPDFARLVAENRYRDCLTMARDRLRDIFALEGPPLRRALRELLETLRDCLGQLGLEPAPGLARDIDALAEQDPGPLCHSRAQELAFRLIDQLFQVSGRGGAHGPDHVQDALNFVERNLHKRVTLEDAAGFAHISPCYLSRLFHKEMDTTFVHYLRDRRIARAKELLRDSSLPIGTVALDLAFADANYFAKAFRKETGMSPTEFRERTRAGT